MRVMECADDNRRMECTAKTLGFYRHEIEYQSLCSLHFPAVVCARIPDRVFGSRKYCSLESQHCPNLSHGHSSQHAHTHLAHLSLHNNL